jgi:uncharacterized peroxidase-related enzyme
MTAQALPESRIPLLERKHLPAEIAALYDQLHANRGVVPNMFKALANVPPLMLGIAVLLKPLMGEGTLPAWYKELVATYVASLNDCGYCTSAHRHLAGQRGASAGQIAGLEDIEIGPFSEKEKAGFRYAGLIHISGHSIDDAAFAEIGAHFNPAEIVELTAVASAFEMFSRLNSALRSPVTPLPVEKAGRG